jgi:hypothetical protein
VSYYFLGGEVIDTNVQHVWLRPTGDRQEPQTLYWIRPGLWVVEVEDTAGTEGKHIPDGFPACVGEYSQWVLYDWYVYRVADDDARAMLMRWGHGPCIWTCACDLCMCLCGESFHTHPWMPLVPGEVALGYCSREWHTVVMQRLTEEYLAKEHVMRGRHG